MGWHFGEVVDFWRSILWGNPANQCGFRVAKSPPTFARADGYDLGY